MLVVNAALIGIYFIEMTIKSEISKIRESFSYGKIKKIYELPFNLVIVKFMPIDKAEAYRYRPVHLFSDHPYQLPWSFSSCSQLFKELTASGRL